MSKNQKLKAGSHAQIARHDLEQKLIELTSQVDKLRGVEAGLLRSKELAHQNIAQPLKDCLDKKNNKLKFSNREIEKFFNLYKLYLTAHDEELKRVREEVLKLQGAIRAMRELMQ